MRRPLPTPGSTTAKWTVPSGNQGAAAASTKEAVSTSPGGTSWETSTRVVPGARRRTVPLTAAT